MSMEISDWIICNPLSEFCNHFQLVFCGYKKLISIMLTIILDSYLIIKIKDDDCSFKISLL